MVEYQSASSISAIEAAAASLAIPALLTRPVRSPSSATVRLIASATCSSLVTSRSITMARWPLARISSATDSVPAHPSSRSCAGNSDGSRAMAVTATSAPSSASRSAMARPIPRFLAAPVTSATIPSSFFMPSQGPLPIDENQFLTDPNGRSAPIDELPLILKRSGHRSLHLERQPVVYRPLEP